MLAASAATAAAGTSINLGGASGGPFGGVTRFMQDVTDWALGPGALFVTILAIVASVVLWNAGAHRADAMGRTFKAVASGIVLLGLPALVNYIRSLL
jgi:type IV secretory pathway VirB2 component (pilin)